MTITFDEAPDTMEAFTCYTLVDITNTRVNDPSKNTPYQQYQNLNTLLQCIGLRALPILVEIEKLEKQNLEDYKFGSKYKKGKSTVWKLTWRAEREGYFTVESLVDDSNGLPVHVSLDETADIPTQVFESKNPKLINVYFETSK
jgi:hypothetical protein